MAADGRGRFAVYRVRCNVQRPRPKNTRAIPSSMMIVDLETPAAPGVVPLGDGMFGAWSFTDGRFICVASDGTDIQRDGRA